jgi:hypothetical protein
MPTWISNAYPAIPGLSILYLDFVAAIYQNPPELKPFKRRIAGASMKEIGKGIFCASLGLGSRAGITPVDAPALRWPT